MKTQSTTPLAAVAQPRLVLPCPFCGEEPIFTEHFKEKGLWNMIHRCRILGGISWDWSSLERQQARWNTRQNTEGQAAAKPLSAPLCSRAELPNDETA